MIKTLAAAVVFALATSAFAAENPWFGTWKLNQEKSTLTGDVYIMTAVPGGYHFDNGGLKYDLLEDGKDHAIVSDETSSLTKTGPKEWLRVNKVKGTEVSRTQWKLSSDDKTLTQTTTGTETDGSTFKSERTVTRIGSGTGIAGTWKQGKFSSSGKQTVIYSDAGNNKMKFEDVQSKTVSIITFDGKPVISTGPRVSPDASATYTRVSPTEFKYTERIKGKPIAYGTETISADGKVITDVDWLADKPNNKYTEIWEKQ